MKKPIAQSLLAAALTCALCASATAKTTDYKNFYVTYMSPAATAAAVNYAKSQGVNHVFIWTVDQDAPINSEYSLIRAINGANPDAVITNYYGNYAVYNNQRAIPGKAYLIKDNADLDSKLKQSNQLVYAFAETQVPQSKDDKNARFVNTPGSYGAVYFYDPWSDLAAGDAFCGKNVSGAPADGAGYNLICAYAFDTKINRQTNDYYQYENTDAFNHFGNIEAFSQLSVNGKNGKPISKYLSIGGFGHNATFEAIFDPKAYGATGITQKQAMENFVNSVALVLTHYQLNGVDIDYEDVNMTHQQSADLYTLLEMLNTKLAPLGKHISLPTISNPEYLNGTERNNTIGFAPGVLSKIAALSQVTYIDPMTYDFSGTFNYGGVSNPGTTGFLTNVFNPTGPYAPKGYKFSIENVISTLKQLGIPMSKVGIGIPAYGRALSNLPASTTDNSYLFSALSPQVVIPAGDQDNVGCDQNITHWKSDNACQGMFSYDYIVKNILDHGVQATDQQDDASGLINGTTAFGASWSPAKLPAWTLTIVNNNAASGQIAVGSFNTQGYKATGTYVYGPKDSPALASIEGETNLPVSFTYWKGTVQCGTADMTHNVTVTINSSAVPACSVS